MIATAVKLQEATAQSLMSEPVLEAALTILNDYQSLSYDEMVKELFIYSSTLSAMSVTLAADALLTDEEKENLTDTIEELTSMSELWDEE